MSLQSAAITDIRSQPQYARFARRLRGMFVDWVLALVLIFGAVLIAVSVGSQSLPRVLAGFVAIILCLYEPVLVSMTGGTIGHYLNNLRVVDDLTGGNLSFRRALSRAALKAVLGWYSFLVMAATRRNQAVHDLLTRSTVQMRDATRASPQHFITERTELASPTLPSRARRAVVTLVYLALALAVYFLVAGAIISLGAISDACLNNDACSAGERIFTAAYGLAYFAGAAVLITLGWRGRLFGARRT
jgi:uncharacterized RDD family membrane protein YckC